MVLTSLQKGALVGAGIAGFLGLLSIKAKAEEPIPICIPNEEQIEYCEDGITPRVKRVCNTEGTGWVETTYDCPIIPECEEGTIEELDYCNDGTLWRWRQCENGVWVYYENICPPECSCTEWTDAGCTDIGYRRETRVCTPSGCDSEERVLLDEEACGECYPGSEQCIGTDLYACGGDKKYYLKLANAVSCHGTECPPEAPYFYKPEGSIWGECWDEPWWIYDVCSEWGALYDYPSLNNNDILDTVKSAIVSGLDRDYTLSDGTIMQFRAVGGGVFSTKFISPFPITVNTPVYIDIRWIYYPPYTPGVGHSLDFYRVIIPCSAECEYTNMDTVKNCVGTRDGCEQAGCSPGTTTEKIWAWYKCLTSDEISWLYKISQTPKMITWLDPDYIKISCDANTPYVTAPGTYLVGETDTFYAPGYTYGQGYIGDMLVDWVSSNTNICTVTPSGSSTMFTAIGPGTCIITATQKGYFFTKTVSVEIIVTENLCAGVTCPDICVETSLYNQKCDSYTGNCAPDTLITVNDPGCGYICTEGETEITDTCPDGTLKAWKLCKNNQWIAYEDECPPSPSLSPNGVIIYGKVTSASTGLPVRLYVSMCHGDPCVKMVEVMTDVNGNYKIDVDIVSGYTYMIALESYLTDTISPVAGNVYRRDYVIG